MTRGTIQFDDERVRHRQGTQLSLVGFVAGGTTTVGVRQLVEPTSHVDLGGGVPFAPNPRAYRVGTMVCFDICVFMETIQADHFEFDVGAILQTVGWRVRQTPAAAVKPPVLYDAPALKLLPVAPGIAGRSRAYDANSAVWQSC